MADTRKQRNQTPRRDQVACSRWIVMVIGLAWPLTIPPAPGPVEASPFGTAPSSEIQVNCPAAVMTKAPTFTASPIGSAAYPFEMQCTNKNGPGVLYLYFEGRWNPSETRQDMPNAVETLFIENYAKNFITGRQQRGTGDNRIFVYWTARCTADPWLQGGSCRRYGEYVPDDVRAAMPDIGLRPFPLTGNSISPSLKQQLIKQYQAANTPASTKQLTDNMTLQAKQLQTQAQRDRAMTIQPLTAIPKSNTGASALSRSGVIGRGVESEKSQSADRQGDVQSELVETSAMAELMEGVPESVGPVTLTLDRPIHVVTTGGEPVVLSPGAYEVQPVLDVHIGLAREGQRTVLVNAIRGTHGEAIPRSLVLAIPGPSNDVHIVMLMTDSRRFDAVGSTAAKSSGTVDIMSAIPDDQLRQAIGRSSVQPRAASPACQPNPADTGPRWIPVPCTMPTAASAGTP